ncbi:MAG: hypothetical protein Q7S71_04485 [Candidatus Nitrotoga sp.]|nr:hypothetical protein [Candidatus Nitrotoga sp.]
MPWYTWRNGIKTENEIRAAGLRIPVQTAGLRALVVNLGLVEAERFITLLSREPFDYTEWRKTALPELVLRKLSRIANKYAEKLDELAENQGATYE